MIGSRSASVNPSHPSIATPAEKKAKIGHRHGGGQRPDDVLEVLGQAASVLAVPTQDRHGEAQHDTRHRGVYP